MLFLFSSPKCAKSFSGFYLENPIGIRKSDIEIILWEISDLMDSDSRSTLPLEHETVAEDNGVLTKQIHLPEPPSGSPQFYQMELIFPFNPE